MTQIDPNHSDPAAGPDQPAGIAYEFDDHSGEFVAQHDRDHVRLSTTVIHLLAEIAGTDVSQAERSLADSVDRDALDALFRPAKRGHVDAAVSFTALVHEVTVSATGEIVIAPLRYDGGGGM